MGRGRGRGGRGRNGGGRGGDRGRDQGPNQRGSYDHTPTNNDTFEAFYKAQNILTPEEWEQNMESLRTPLPTNFRFTGSKANATKLLELMKKNYFPSVQDIEIDGEKIPPPQNLPWYPNNFGWQYKPTRSAIRSHEGIKKFHEFLMAETECGNVSRQEAVSMIPPLLLDVQPGHYVLDMCAAPGSKTAQLIENVQSNNEVLPAGLVIANDADYKRAFMLVKQSKRLQSPCLIVTNHEAQFLPYIYFTPKGEEPVDGERALQFDRILCDVPCCGDGTLRKNKMIWRSWHQSNGNSLNKIQLAILLRAIHFLKVGGRVVYSTCTFNPVENEAVVAAALNKCGTAIKLLDVSKQLPALKRRPGISNWKVMDPEGTMHDSYDTVPDKYKDKKLYAECFPPANAAELNLERCLRIVPFDQDTGAFFVAVFEKVEPFGGLDKPAAPVGDGTKRKVEETEAEPSDGKRVQLENNEEPAEKKKSAAAWEGKNEEPFVFVSKEHADVTSVVDFWVSKFSRESEKPLRATIFPTVFQRRASPHWPPFSQTSVS
ncbi:S-adenosyl-L-methionine-dependent methyltransferase [Chytriomyces sp. MP71]|nr:S-adenosyl-L-methionine-dependent methyltransferase [Chytriomyces sp. MP71]